MLYSTFEFGVKKAIEFKFLSFSNIISSSRN